MKATPSTLCIQKQWDLGRLRGPRQTLWNYSFPPTSSDRSASLCWRLKLSAYCKYTFLLKPSLSLTKDWAKKNLMQILIRVLLRRWGKVHLSSCSLFLTVKLATKHSHQPQKKDKKKARNKPGPKFECFSKLSHSWGMISFWIKWGSGPQSSLGVCLCVCEWKMATFMSVLWDNIITFRWLGSRALYSQYKDHGEYWGEGCHLKS